MAPHSSSSRRSATPVASDRRRARHRVAGLPSGLVRSAAGRLLAATLVLVLSGLVVGGASPAAQAAVDDSFTVTLTPGSPGVVVDATTVTPLAETAGGQYTLPTAQATATVRFSLDAQCVIEDGACAAATVTLGLDQLQLAALLSAPAHTAGSAGYEVEYLDGSGVAVADPATRLGDVRSLRLTFSSYGAGGTLVPLEGGTLISYDLDATVVLPAGGGTPTGTLTVAPAVGGVAQTASTVEVVTTVVPVLSTSTQKSWTPSGPYLSGADDTTRTADIVFTNTGQTATSLVVDEPAEPTAVPQGAEAFNLLRVTGLALDAFPVGTDSVTVSTWHDGVAGPSTTATDLPTVQAWLAGLGSTELDRLTGVRLAFTGTFAGGATGTLHIATEQIEGGSATPGAVTGRHGSVAYDETGAAPTAATSSDFHTVLVSNSADTTASSTVVGSVPVTSSGTASFRVWDPDPYAGSTKRFLTPGTLADTTQVYPGGFAVVQLTGTSWTRRAVDSLVLSDQPDTSDGAVAAAVTGVRAAGLDAAMFSPSGLVLAGFGTSVVSGAGDGQGLVWPAGADSVTLTLRAGGETATWTGAVGAALPTGIAEFSGFAGTWTWADVTGFDARFDGEIEMGASATVPYVVTTGAAATVGATVANVALARTTVEGLTSAPTPRTATSGNKPVSVDSLTVAEPYPAATITKTIPEPYVDVAGGSVTAVLRGVAHVGTDLPTTLVLEDSVGAWSGSDTWWNRFAPTSITVSTESDVDYVLQFADGPAGAPNWQVAPDPTTWTVATTKSWTGVRVVATKRSGQFDEGEVVQAVLRFTVALDGTTTFADGLSVRNCAVPVARLDYGGPVESVRTGTRACDTVVGYALDGGVGPAALAKTLSADTLAEGRGGSTTATLTWGTAGRADLTSVTVTDADTAADGTVLEGRDASFWDTFDVLSLPAITSGPAASGSTAYDPYLAFDQVSDVQVYDTVDDQWVSLATRQWDESLQWQPVSAARTDVRFGSATVAAFPYRLQAAPSTTVLPAVTIVSDGLRERIGGVRIVVEGLDALARAAVVTRLETEGDWRVPALTTGLVPGAVAGTDGPARELKVTARLRTVSRANPLLVVNDAATYNHPLVASATPPSLVVDDGRVQGVGGSAPFTSTGAANQVDHRTVTLTPTPVRASATKRWTRAADNPGDITDGTEHVHNVPLPSAGGDPAAAVLAVTGGNGSTVPVDSLTLTEPSGIDQLVGSDLPEGSPFAWFAIDQVTTLTSFEQLAGADDVLLTAYVLDGDGQVDDVAITIADAGAPGLADDLPTALDLAGLAPADLVGLRLEYSGRIAPAAVASLTARTVLRDANLVTGVTPAAALALLPDGENFQIDNTVRVAVADRIACDGTPEVYTGTGGCTPVPDVTTRTDYVRIQAPHVQAFASKQFTSSATVLRDSGAPVVAELEVQSFGNNEPDTLTLTDADPTFFDAVALSGVRLGTLPTGAQDARLDVLLRTPGLTVGSDGTYSTAPVEGDWTTVGTIAAAGDWPAPTAGWSDVIGVRVVFAAASGAHIATPGTQVGAVTLTGALRTDLLSGGLPAATGADPAWGEPTTNPGESLPATVSNTVEAVASRGGVSSDPEDATASFTVAAGTERLRVTKTSGTAPGGGWRPDDSVPYTITVRNDGTADILGLVVTDRLPADDTLSWGGQSTVTSVPAPFAALATVVGDADAGTVTVSWPTDSRLEPGQSVTVVLPLTIATAPSTLTIVNTADASATGRPVVANPTGNGGSGACVTGSYRADGATGACTVSTAALSMNASNIFLSEKWESTGSTTATSTTASATCAPRGSGADGTWFRYPCASDVAPGGKIDWQVQVRSLADAATPTVTVVDMLPRPDDYQAMKTSGRGSQWRPVWDGVLPTVVPATDGSGAVFRTDGVVRYFVTTADYTTTTATASTSYDPLPAQEWTEVTASLSSADAARVTGLKLVIDYSGRGGFVKNNAVRLQWSMRAPLGATDGAVAWNSFAFQVEPEGRAPLASVPLKSGARYALPSTLFAVGDRVWRDVDGDGVQDAGEPSVAGVTVSLLAADGTVLGTTTSDSDGAYLFDGLPAGTYSVRFELGDPALAARYRWTTPGAGGDVARDSDPTPVSGSLTVAQGTPFTLDVASATVVEVTDGSLAARYVDRTRDAGLVDAPLAIGDRVWLDADHDGIQGAGEPGLAGVVVRLLSADGQTVLATTTTDADGWYAVGGLTAGDYVVEFVPPSGYRFSRPVQGGDVAADSDASRSTGRTAVVHLGYDSDRVRPTTEGERAALAVAGTDAGMIDPTVDAGVYSLAVAGPVTDVTVRKSVTAPVTGDGAPAVVQGGDTVTYSLTASTTGTVAAEDVVLDDAVPAGLAVTEVTAEAGDPAWTCTVAGQDARGYGGTVHCVLADDLLAGSTAPAVLVTAVVDPLIAVDTIVNTVTVGASNEDPDLVVDNTDSATVPVRWLAVTAAPTCVADAPWLDYTVEAHQVDTATLPLTVTWYADADGDGVADGPAVATRTLPAGSSLSGSTLWPGASVDSEGRGSAWPGWRVVRAGETPMRENLVLDPSLPEYALRAGALVEFSINPVRSVTVAYPAATLGCEVGGAPVLLLSKTAGKDEVQPGDAVDYTLAVRSTGVGATDDAVLTDTLPPELRVTGVTVAERTSPDAPTWKDCAVTGQDAAGYGGVVTCVLDGWVGQGQTLPAVVIETTVSPDAEGVTRNVAAVRWGDPETGESVEGTSDSGADVEVRSEVLAADPGAVPVVRAVLERTGASVWPLAALAVLLVLTGAGAVLLRTRRRPG